MELTESGGEDMVVKLRATNIRRGREYLSIIYGPEYTARGAWSVCWLAAWAPSAPTGPARV